jgi:hypothetical protein
MLLFVFWVSKSYLYSVSVAKSITGYGTPELTHAALKRREAG